jgi:hypothetical protein
VISVVEDIRRRLVDRDGSRAGGGIGDMPGVEHPCFEAIISIVVGHGLSSELEKGLADSSPKF